MTIYLFIYLSTWSWPWSLDRAMVKWNYANETPRSDVNMPTERSCATLYLLALAIFALSVTICEKFAIEMCMTLILIFRFGQCRSNCARGWPWPLDSSKIKLKYANGKAVRDFLCVDNSNVCPICHRLRHNHVWKCQRMRFESLALKWRPTYAIRIFGLKMKAKDVEDLDENWQANTPWQLAYVC